MGPKNHSIRLDELVILAYLFVKIGLKWPSYDHAKCAPKWCWPISILGHNINMAFCPSNLFYAPKSPKIFKIFGVCRQNFLEA